jgi:ribose transport system substrate-binding protein
MMIRRTLRATVAVGAAVAMAVVAAGCGDTSDSGARISLVLPGPNAYFDPWQDAARDVSEQHGVDVSFDVPASAAFDLTQQNSLVNSLAAKGYNGFAFFPADANGTNAQQQKLADRGIPSINVNACTQDPGPALFCISTDVYDAAYYQAQELIKAIGGAGEIALLTSQLTDPNTQLRIEAVEAAVAETGGAVTLAQVVADIDTPQDAPPAVNALLATRGAELEGVMSTSYNPSVAMATALTDSPAFRDVVFIGAENAPQMMDAIDKGYVHGTLFQNTYGMAYLAAYTLSKVASGTCTVSPTAPFESTDQTSKLLPAGVLLVTKQNSAEFAGKPESLPDDTERLLRLIDEQVLTC